MKYDHITNEQLIATFNACGAEKNSDDETAQIYKRVKANELNVKWNDTNTHLIICDAMDINKLT